MVNFLTAIGNGLFVLAATGGMVYFHYWLTSDILEKHQRRVVWAWFAKDTAVALRIGWWLLGLLTAEEGKRYAAWSIEYAHLMTIPTSLLYVMAQSEFVAHIQNFTRMRQIASVGIAILVVIAVTWAGF